MTTTDYDRLVQGQRDRMRLAEEDWFRIEAARKRRHGVTSDTSRLRPRQLRRYYEAALNAGRYRRDEEP